MSWYDKCKECGEPKRDCECKYVPPQYSQEELDEHKRKLDDAKRICSKIGHDFKYSFIIYTCTRCGETTEY